MNKVRLSWALAALVLAGLASGLYRAVQDDAPIFRSLPLQKDQRKTDSQARVFETTNPTALLSEPALGIAPGDGGGTQDRSAADAGVTPGADAGSEAETANAPLPRTPPVSTDETSDDAGATPEADESSDTRLAPHRFQVRWNDEGQCGDKPLAALRASRDALLSSFEERRFGDALLRFDSRLPPAMLSLVHERLMTARGATAQWIDWSPNTPPPPTVVYFDSAQLRSVACVSEQTVGYYDGNLHISADTTLGETVIGQTVLHEYVHFALNALGVKKPMWLHEGLAMHVAEETWWANTKYDLRRWVRDHHLSFDEMVLAFPHTADEKFAVASYYQSHRMVDFLIARRGVPVVRELVRQLSIGVVSAADAFAAGAGIPTSQLESQWKAFVQ